jgi:diguanylate cyclase (GGDEF)-like protein/PAS domain S-box-containing protein
MDLRRPGLTLKKKLLVLKKHCGEILAKRTLSRIPRLIDPRRRLERPTRWHQHASEKLQLAARFMSSTTEGVFITERDGRIVYVNPAFCHMTKYSRPEVIGRSLGIVQPVFPGEQSCSDIWQMLQLTGQWQGEISSCRKSGEALPLWLSMSAAKDSSGRVLNYVGVISDLTKMREVASHLERMAYHDPLTGLPNRTLFLDRLGQILARSGRTRRAAALMFLDLDHFKKVNDTLGHAMGDKLLAAVGKRLSSCLRETDTVARIGGDEFTIILPDIADNTSLTHMAHRITSGTSDPFDLDGHQVFVTVSLGIALYPDDGRDGERLLQNADTAMYHAKARGGNCFQYFSDEMNIAARARGELERALRLALVHEELVLHYQPQVHIPSGKIIGCEALIRWNRPHHGQVLPHKFIPLAEEAGLIGAIGNWTVSEACAQIREWQTVDRRRVRVAVNISGRQLQQENTVSSLREILDRTGIDPGLLELEITESSLMQDAAASRQVLARLKDLGLHIAIDDFGVGYSSLGQLRHFPVSRLKIDRSFFRGLTSNNQDKAVVKAITAIAHSLQVSVIAEGVETQDHVDFLKCNGCEEAQGHYFCRPLPPEKFVTLIDRAFGPPPPDFRGGHPESAELFSLNPDQRGRPLLLRE